MPEDGYYFFDCRVIRGVHFACYLMHKMVCLSLYEWKSRAIVRRFSAISFIMTEVNASFRCVG